MMVARVGKLVILPYFAKGAILLEVIGSSHGNAVLLLNLEDNKKYVLMEREIKISKGTKFSDDFTFVRVNC